MKLTEREEKLLNRLGIGRENAKKAPQLGNARILRRIVASLRRKEYPICSGDEGYWIAKDEQEKLESVSMINSRIARLTAVSEGLKKSKIAEELKKAEERR